MRKAAGSEKPVSQVHQRCYSQTSLYKKLSYSGRTQSCLGGSGNSLAWPWPENPKNERFKKEKRSLSCDKADNQPFSISRHRSFYSSPHPHPRLHSTPLLPCKVTAYSRLTSLPKHFAFTQSRITKTRFLVLKHMLKYALLQNKYVNAPPLAKFPLSQLISATAFSLPMYAKLPWWLYSKGPICLTRRRDFWRALMWLKISLRSSEVGAWACAADNSRNSALMVSVLARELKRRARNAPSWEATWAVGA